MQLSSREQFLAKIALRATADAGEAGILEPALYSLTEIAAGTILPTAQRRALLALLLEKNWLYSYRDPITGNTRYALSEEGRLAARAL